jgi:hypothetical protein
MDDMIQYFNANSHIYTTEMAEWVRIAIPILPSLHYPFLIWACRAGFLDIVQMIPLDTSIEDNVPIRQAALHGHDDIVQWFLLDPRVNDPEGKTVQRLTNELKYILEQ